MYIYKITNKINNKIYIGQTTKNIKERFKEHIYNAEYTDLNTNLVMAIRKYGKENFQIEKIDEAKTKDELNQKEIFWIKKYNAVKNGYNMTEEAIGGNTYKYIPKNKMDKIKEKLSISKSGAFNPHAIKIKCKNVITSEELIFDTVCDCKNYFEEKNHNFITRRTLNKTKYLYKGQWLIAYYNEEYIDDYTMYKNNRRAKEIIVTNISTDETKEFHSFASAERYFNLNPKTLSSKAHRKGNDFIVKNFHVVVK